MAELWIWDDGRMTGSVVHSWICFRKIGSQLGCMSKYVQVPCGPCPAFVIQFFHIWGTQQSATRIDRNLARWPCWVSGEDWGWTNKQRVNIDPINHDKWVGHRTHIEFRIHWCSKFGSRQTRSFLPNYEQLTLGRFWRDYPKHPNISQNFVPQDAGFDVLLSCYKESACSLAQTLSVNRIQHK